MNGLRKSVLVIGQVLGLLMGDKFNTPISEVLKRHPYLRFSA